MLIQSLNGVWQFRKVGNKEWFPATVPGSVHFDLLTAGLIPDPFVGDNEKQVKWVAEANWEYRCNFSPQHGLQAQAKILLVCYGLDTLAEIRLNGSLINQAQNMFRHYRMNLIDCSSTITEQNLRSVVLISELWHAGECVALCLATFVPNKHLRFEDPHLTIDAIISDSQCINNLQSRSLARFVEVSLTGDEAIFSDNYFDLPADRLMSIHCPLPAGWTLEHARANLQIRLLFDTF